MFWSLTTQAQVYPSTEVAWVLPGQWEAPKVPLKQKSAEDVLAWEMAHSDLVFGSFQDPQKNRQTTAIGYMYAQKFDCRPQEKEAFLMQTTSITDRFDMESAYLHFAEDTVLTGKTFSTGINYLLNGEIYHLILERKGNYQTARLPLAIQPNDTIFVLSSYPFDAIFVDATHKPSFSAPIRNLQDEITGWQSISANWQNQEAQFSQRVGDKPTFPQVKDRTLNTGIKTLEQGLKIWALKLTWQQAAQLTSLRLPSYLQKNDNEITILGWDPKNDLNHDGYLDKKEFLQRPNKKASAKFIEQARIISIGHHWPGGCWYRTNLSDPTFYPYYAKWYDQHWQTLGLNGAYNDDLAKLLGDNQFTPIKGGKLLEMPNITVGNTQATKIYGKQLASFFHYFKKRYPQYQLSANISEYNPWQYAAWPPELIDVLDIWLREHYLRPSIGLKRLQKNWDNFALAQQGDKSLLMNTTKQGRSFYQPQSQQAWHTDIETGLALYYFFNVPQHTYFNSWNQTWRYGSHNTSTQIWYRAGVPQNLAYHPQALLEINIGTPSTSPKGYPIVNWIDSPHQASTSARKLDKYNLMPANWFWIDKTSHDGVIARQYSEGLVLYRGHHEANHKPYYTIPSKVYSLPEKYHRVTFDGRLLPPSDTIELLGYQGVILKKPNKVDDLPPDRASP